MTQSESLANLLYTDQMRLAERKLSAFIIAVAELFGADQARMSVEDGLDESWMYRLDLRPGIGGLSRSQPRFGWQIG
jgi:hypothetical protein